MNVILLIALAAAVALLLVLAIGFLSACVLALQVADEDAEVGNGDQ